MNKRTIVLPGVLAGILLLAACGGGSTDTTSTPTTGSGGGSSSSDAENADFNDADVAFASGMTPHHAQAVEMSEMVLDSNPSPEVAALAERIKAAQDPEIAELNEMLDHFGVEKDSSGGHSAHGGGDGEAVMHGGMMTDAQMQDLMAASGADAERMFLTSMIAHHEGAIEAAETQLAEGTYAPALDLAERIKADQAAEIAEMEQLLTQI